MIKYLKFAIFFPSILVITTIHGKIVLKENFDTNVLESKKWIKSDQEKYQDQPVMILPGPNPVPGYENDKGIQLTQEMKHYGFGSKFSEPLQVKDSDFVIQYEVKFADTLSCGGAYVKLIRDDIDLTELKDSTPYTVFIYNISLFTPFIHILNQQHALPPLPSPRPQTLIRLCLALIDVVRTIKFILFYSIRIQSPKLGRKNTLRTSPRLKLTNNLICIHYL